MQAIDINSLNLPSVLLTERSKLPTTPCVYLAIDSQGVVQYIGKSTNLRQRWVKHHKQSGLEKVEGVRLAWIEVTDLLFLPELESALIDYFQPTFNLTGLAVLPKNIDMDAGKQVARLRERAGLTQREVAKALNKTDQTISNWENGTRAFKLIPLEALALCKVLECTLEQLAGEG